MTDEALTREQLRDDIAWAYVWWKNPDFKRKVDSGVMSRKEIERDTWQLKHGQSLADIILALLPSAGEQDNLLTGIAEVYQVVGTLSDMAGVFDDPQTIKVLDWLADPKGELDVLPYHPEAKPTLLPSAQGKDGGDFQIESDVARGWNEGVEAAAITIETKHTNNVGMVHPIALTDAKSIRALKTPSPSKTERTPGKIEFCAACRDAIMDNSRKCSQPNCPITAGKE